MKLVFTRAKIKTSYELLLCADAGKGQYTKRARRERKAFQKRTKIRLVINNFKPEIIVLACVS